MTLPITLISSRDQKALDRAYDNATNNFNYAKGVRIFESYRKKHPRISDQEFLYRLALLYDHLGPQIANKRVQYENRAFRLYEKILQINPDSYKAVWGIARIWWHRKNRKAIPFALRARQMVQNSARRGDIVAKQKLAGYTQNVGLVYDVLGDDKNAEHWLLKGLRMQPQDWGMYLNMVQFYRRKGYWKKLKIPGRKLDVLFRKETSAYKATAWGKAILDIIEYTKKPTSELKKILEKEKEARE